MTNTNCFGMPVRETAFDTELKGPEHIITFRLSH